MTKSSTKMQTLPIYEVTHSSSGVVWEARCISGKTLGVGTRIDPTTQSRCVKAVTCAVEEPSAPGNASIPTKATMRRDTVKAATWLSAMCSGKKKKARNQATLTNSDLR